MNMPRLLCNITSYPSLMLALHYRLDVDFGGKKKIDPSACAQLIKVILVSVRHGAA